MLVLYSYILLLGQTHDKGRGSPGYYWTCLHRTVFLMEQTKMPMPAWVPGTAFFHATHCLQRRNLVTMVCTADTTWNIKHLQTCFAGLPAQEKQLLHYKFPLWPVQTGVRNTHTVALTLLPTWYEQRGVALPFYLQKRHGLTPSACVSPHSWGFSELEVRNLFVALFPINWEQGLFSTSLTSWQFLTMHWKKYISPLKVCNLEVDTSLLKVLNQINGSAGKFLNATHLYQTQTLWLLINRHNKIDFVIILLVTLHFSHCLPDDERNQNPPVPHVLTLTEINLFFFFW